MQATKALTHSQRASQALVVFQITAITFGMSAMVGRHPPQLKMPRLDAYGADAQSADSSPLEARIERRLCLVVQLMVER